MKIDFSTSAQQTQTELNEKFFSISDPAFVFDLLRNKIYSNPILAVCRELSCNALDAHREVGKGDVPIVITLPSHQDSYFKVKDFGPGISPSRIDDIYLKYAASTKRDSNDQIGAFGIGAKSPFSYSESFTIVTNHDGKCYNYMAFIDESRMGKLILLSESDTEDQNGTEIIVPVKSSDIHVFQENVEKCIRHWKVKPTILGGKIAYRNVVPVIGTNDWFISGDRENYYERKVKVLVGEIEYNLDSTAIKAFSDTSILSAVNSDIYLCFDVGEISLAANRESVYLDQQTKKAIASKMSKIKSEYTALLFEKINSQSTYLDACCFVNGDLRSLCDGIKWLQPIHWNGIPVVNNIQRNENFTIWEFSQKKSHWSDSVKISRRNVGYISFNAKFKAIIHDCGQAEPSSRHVKPFFQDFSDVKSIYVIHPTKSGEESFSLTSFLDEENLGHYGFEFLSKHNKQIKSKKSSEKTKMIVYKMDKHGSFNVVTQSDASADASKKLFVHLKKDAFRNRRYPVDTEKRNLEISTLRSVLELDSNLAIYGVDDNIEEDRIYSSLKVSGSVTDYIEEWYENLDQDLFMKCLWAESEVREFNQRSSAIYSKLIGMILSQDNPISHYVEHQNNVRTIISENRGFINLLHSLGKGVRTEDFDKYCGLMPSVSKIYNNIKLSYPMLELMDSYRSMDHLEKVADYINLVDRAKTSC